MPRHAVSRIHTIKIICGLVVGFRMLGLDQTLLFAEDPLDGSWLLLKAAREQGALLYTFFLYKPVTV